MSPKETPGAVPTLEISGAIFMKITLFKTSDVGEDMRLEYVGHTKSGRSVELIVWRKFDGVFIKVELVTKRLVFRLPNLVVVMFGKHGYQVGIYTNG